MMNGSYHFDYQQSAIQRHIDEIQSTVDQMKDVVAGNNTIQSEQAEALVAVAGKLLRRVAMAHTYEEIRSNGGVTFDQPEKAP